MQLLWICMALCAAVLSCAEARYAPSWQQERALRLYKNGLKGGYPKGYNKPEKDKFLQLEQSEKFAYSGDGSGDGTIVDDYHDSKDDGLGDGVEPFDPSDIGKGIEPEVPQVVRVPTMQYVPLLTTARPQPRTQKPDNYWGFWNNVASAVGDIGNTLDDVASNVGDTVGDWGEGVGDTFNDWGETVGDWGENVGRTFDDLGENIVDTFDDLGEGISNTIDNWGDKIEGTYNETQVQVLQAHVALLEAAKIAGEKLRQTYLEAKEGLPTLRDQVMDSLRHFGILVSNGAEYVFNKITQITDQISSAAIILKIQEKLDQGDEQVAEFLQLIGHKMETWFQTHTQITQQADVFQDAEIQGELQELVNHGILTANDVTILIETSSISEKLVSLMERGDASVTELIQLLEQKIARWSDDTEGGVSQITQQLPAFFQDYEIQEELKELVEQGILTRRDVTTLTESTSVINKLEQALEIGDDRVTQIMTLMADREAVLEQQQNQHNVEIIPNIFQDDEVRQDLQKLVDAGIFTDDDFNILTQQESQQGVIAIDKRQYSGWLDSIGDTFDDLGDTLSDTASNVGDTVSDWGSQTAKFVVNTHDQVVDAVVDAKDAVVDSHVGQAVGGWGSQAGEAVGEWGSQAAEFAVNAADQVVDAAADAKDAVADVIYDKRYVFPKKMNYRGQRGWVDSVGETFEDWGDTMRGWGGHIARFADNAADQVADAAVNAKDAIVDAFDKRELSSADIRK